jgi:hypothetical protein
VCVLCRLDVGNPIAPVKRDWQWPVYVDSGQTPHGEIQISSPRCAQGLTGPPDCSTFVLVEVETLGIARSLGWKVHMRCAGGYGHWHIASLDALICDLFAAKLIGGVSAVLSFPVNDA